MIDLIKAEERKKEKSLILGGYLLWKTSSKSRVRSNMRKICELRKPRFLIINNLSFFHIREIIFNYLNDCLFTFFLLDIRNPMMNFDIFEKNFLIKAISLLELILPKY